MSEVSADDILKFWFDDIEHVRWFKSDPAFDRELEQRFGGLLKQARDNKLDHWCDTPQGHLALIIVLDQFSRNIHRGDAMAFDADPKALQLTLDGIEKSLDVELTPEQRSFFYLPLRHAEDLSMQELGLKKTREINAAGYGSDKYALSHMATIERFGRFPHRNECLGRPNTPEEATYLEDSGAS